MKLFLLSMYAYSFGLHLDSCPSSEVRKAMEWAACCLLRVRAILVNFPVVIKCLTKTAEKKEGGREREFTVCQSYSI